MRLDDLRQLPRLRRLVTNAWDALRHRRAGAGEPELTVRLRAGGTLVLRPGTFDGHIFREVFARDDYRLDALPPGRLRCVLDLGGNVGIFSVRAAALAERVIVYEPIVANFERLQRHVQDLANVTTRREAVAGRTGTLRLFHPQDPRNSGQYSGHTDDPGAPYDEVAAVTLDQVFGRHDIDRCDLLKIDVEGLEYEILHGASDETLARIERIHGEYHDRARDDPRTRIEHFRAFLRSKGYRVELQPDRKKANFGLFFATRPQPG